MKDALDARAATGIDDCAIVTWDTEADLGDGIRAIPVWKWCLALERGSARGAAVANMV